MRCPFCDSQDLKVVDKRSSNNNSIRRRRECISCHKRFSTYEKIQAVVLTVIKSNGSEQPFQREKIQRGITLSLEKRNISDEKINLIVDEIERKLRTQESTKLTSKYIGELVTNKLKLLDKVAYIRFTSIYKNFSEVKHFEDEVKKIK